MTGVLSRKSCEDTGEGPCDSRGGDWSGAVASQGETRFASNSRKLGESHGIDSPSELPEGTKPADTSVSDKYPPEL